MVTKIKAAALAYFKTRSGDEGTQAQLSLDLIRRSRLVGKRRGVNWGEP